MTIDASGPPSRSSRRSSSGALKASLDRPQVLVVDDDLDIREIVSEVLTDAGYKVIVASNGEIALRLLETERPALILLDLNMPVMDGIEFRRRQRASASLARIPTVVMSAMHQMRDRIAGLEVEEALAKPVELRRLLEVARRFCPPQR